MNRHSPNPSGAVTELPEQALTCAAREVIMRKCSALFFHLCASVFICGLGLGCSVTRGIRHPDGTLTVTNYRLLWSSENVAFTTHTADFSAALKIGKSATDDAAVSAVVAGIVKGITRP